MGKRWVMVAALAIASALAGPAAADDANEKRCARGLAAQRDGNLARAELLLADCASAEGQDAWHEVTARLKAGDHALVVVSIQPAGAQVEIAALGEPFASPRDVWLPPGKHAVRVTARGHRSLTTELVAAEHSRTSLVARLQRESAPAGGGEIDFGEDDPAAAAEVQTALDPRPQKHESMLPERYRKAPDPVVERTDRGGRRTWPWLAIGAGVAAIAAGAIVHASADGDAGVAGAVGLYAAGGISLGVGIVFSL